MRSLEQCGVSCEHADGCETIPRVGTQCNKEPLFEAFMPACSGQGLVVGSKSVSNDKTFRELAKSPITNACRVSCSQRRQAVRLGKVDSVEVRHLGFAFHVLYNMHIYAIHMQ